MISAGVRGMIIGFDVSWDQAMIFFVIYGFGLGAFGMEFKKPKNGRDGAKKKVYEQGLCHISSCYSIASFACIRGDGGHEHGLNKHCMY